MVWYGMVWYGMVWEDMGRYGKAWHEVWHGMVLYAKEWYGMVWDGIRYACSHVLLIATACVLSRLSA